MANVSYVINTLLVSYYKLAQLQNLDWVFVMKLLFEKLDFSWEWALE